MGKDCVIADGGMYEGECELHRKPVDESKLHINAYKS